MAKGKRPGSGTKSKGSSLLNQPAVGKGGIPKAGRSTDNARIIKDPSLKRKPTPKSTSSLAKASRSAAKNASTAKSKVDSRLLSRSGRPLVGAALEERLKKLERQGTPIYLDKRGRPLTGNALKMMELKLQRQQQQQQAAAEEAQREVHEQIAAQAQQAIQSELDAEEEHRLYMLKLRDRKRTIVRKIQIRQRRYREKLEEEQRARQIEATAQSMREMVESWRAEQGDAYAPPTTETADTRTALDNFTGALITPEELLTGKPPLPRHPTTPPKGRRTYTPNKWKQRGYDKPWEDPEQIELMEAAGVLPEDENGKPTTNPRKRQQEVEKQERDAAETIADTIGDEVEEVLSGKRSRKRSSGLDDDDTPESVVIEPKNNKELFSGLDNLTEENQTLTDVLTEKFKQEARLERQRELDRRRKENRDNDFSTSGRASGAQKALDAITAGPRGLFAEAGNVLMSLAKLGGVLATLAAGKELFERGPRVINSVADSVLGMQQAYYELIGDTERAAEIAKRRAAINPENLASGQDKAVVGGIAGAALGMTRWGRSLMSSAVRHGAGMARGLAGRALGWAAANPVTVGIAGLVYSPDLGGGERPDGTRQDERPLGDNLMRTEAELRADLKSGDEATRRRAARSLVAKKYWDPNTRSYGSVQKDGFDREVEAMLHGVDTSSWNQNRASGGSGSFQGKASADETKAINYLMTKHGYTQEQAVGLVANFRHESNMNTRAAGDHISNMSAANRRGVPVDANGKTAFGLAQWRGDRVKQFEAMYGKKIVDATLEEQLDYVHHELQTSHRGAGQALARARTAEEATRIITTQYEMPAQAALKAVERARTATQMMRANPNVQQGAAPVGEFQSKESVAPQPAPAAAPNAVASQMMGMPSDLAGMPGLHSNFIDDTLLIAFNGGALT